MSSVGRRIAILAVAVLVAALCVAAGTWQWERHRARSAANATLESNVDRDPVPIDRLVDPGRPLPGTDTWRPVTVVGEYLPGATVQLRNRPVQGRPAVGLLEMLVITEGGLAGHTLVVHRGWVAPGDDVADDEPVPPVPDTVVELVVRLRPSETPGREPSGGQVQRIATDQVLAASEAERAAPLEAYGVVVTEAGAPPQGLHTVPLPETGFGPHLSYAFQWWVFAVGALVGALVLIRRDREHAAPAPGHPTHDGGVPATRPDAAARPHPPRRPRRLTAEEEEDALVDAASHPGAPSDPA